MKSDGLRSAVSPRGSGLSGSQPKTRYQQKLARRDEERQAQMSKNTSDLRTLIDKVDQHTAEIKRLKNAAPRCEFKVKEKVSKLD